MPASRTIALPGATGFIGRRVAARLASAGHRVIALARPGSKRLSAVPEGCELRETHLREDAPGLAEALDEADAVVFAAGAVRGRTLDAFRPANLGAPRAVARLLARRSTPAPLLHLSSLAASEPGISPYAQSKREGEEALEAFPEAPAAILRPPIVYGPGDTEMRPLFALMRAGLAPLTGPRGQRLSFLHVDDLAEAVLAWTERSDATSGARFPIHDGKERGYDADAIVSAVAGEKRVLRVRIPHFLLAGLARGNAALAKATGGAPMLTPGKLREIRHPAWIGDNAGFAEATGWRPRIGLAEGVARLFEKTP